MTSLVVLFLMVAEQQAQPVAVAEPPVVVEAAQVAPPPPTARPDHRLIDLEADTLSPGESQFNLWGLVYTRGILPRFSLSTSIAADAVTALNLTASVQLVDAPFLRLTAEVGGAYLVAAPFLNIPSFKASFYAVPAEVRATVPLVENLALTIAAKYRMVGAQLNGDGLAAHSLGAAATLVYHDRVGSTFLQVMVPVVNIMRSSGVTEGVPVQGTLALDNVASWGVMLGRDQRLGRTGHLRVGVGYRNEPGILVLDSYGKLMVSLDYYWR